jgi:hypothetical protein
MACTAARAKTHRHVWARAGPTAGRPSAMVAPRKLYKGQAVSHSFGLAEQGSFPQCPWLTDRAADFTLISSPTCPPRWARRASPSSSKPGLSHLALATALSDATCCSVRRTGSSGSRMLQQNPRLRLMPEGLRRTRLPQRATSLRICSRKRRLQSESFSGQGCGRIIGCCRRRRSGCSRERRGPGTPVSVGGYVVGRRTRRRRREV